MGTIIIAPNLYCIVKNKSGEIFRYHNELPIPKGYELAEKDEYGQPYIDPDGRLNPRFWAVRRLGVK